MNHYKLYTDGACSGNPGPGGYGFALVKDEQIIYSNGEYFDHTTNNKMELTAVIKGIQYIFSHFSYSDLKEVTVYTDSAYVMNAMKDWVHNWKKNNWKKSNKKPIENLELIQTLYALCYESGLTVHWQKVKAHQPKTSKDYDPFNDYVDQLATRNIKPHQS